MDGVDIRRARLADLPAIVALLADDDFGESREDSTTPLIRSYIDAFHAIDDDPNQLLAVLEAHGRTVGTLQISFIPGLSYRGAWRGQLEAVRIASDCRNMGLGTQLIDWAVAECRKRGCTQIQLLTNRQRAAAHRFYERLGFVGSHFGYKLVLAAAKAPPA
jgi:ribosomal protein S18 acetylase RimI-like enzyme